MNCYNSEKYVAEAIQSVLGQTYQNWEIIFWDNASTDKTKEIATSFDDARIKYFRGETNVPLYNARNYAFEKTTGEFVAFLDYDDTWAPDKLKKQMPLFEDPEVGIAYTDIFYIRNGIKIRQLFKIRPYYVGHCFSQLLSDYFVPLVSIVIRKECFSKLDHFFDERFQIIGDADIVRRIALCGWKLDMINEPLSNWRWHDSNLTFKESGRTYKENEQMLEKYFSEYPGFKEKYKNEIFNLRSGVVRSEAKLLLAQKKFKELRKILAPYLSQPKNLFLYLLSYFPQPFIYLFLKKVN